MCAFLSSAYLAAQTRMRPPEETAAPIPAAVTFRLDFLLFRRFGALQVGDGHRLTWVFLHTSSLRSNNKNNASRQLLVCRLHPDTGTRQRHKQAKHTQGARKSYPANSALESVAFFRGESLTSQRHLEGHDNHLGLAACALLLRNYWRLLYMRLAAITVAALMLCNCRRRRRRRLLVLFLWRRLLVLFLWRRFLVLFL